MGRIPSIGKIIEASNVRYNPNPRAQVKYMVPFGYTFLNWNIRHGDIYDSYFDHINAIDGHLEDVRMKRCVFRGGYFCGVTFDDWSSRGTIFFNTVFSNCSFGVGLSLRAVTFIECTFDKCKFSGDMTLSDSAIPSCVFAECIFSDGVAYDRDSEVSFERCKNVPYIPMTCPEESGFLGYKKANLLNKITGEQSIGIVTLYIPADAKRSSAYGRKCRCNKATVIGIEKRNGEKLNGEEYDIHSYFDPCFTYHVYDTIVIDDFVEDRWAECAPGFHFFMNKEEARRY